jgi:hypothetical protein
MQAGCRERAPAVAAARRLTREQYRATIRDLFGDPGAAGDRLPAEDAGDGLEASATSLIVSPAWAESAMSAAEELARRAVGRLDALVPCAGRDEGCARTFITDFGARAFRRPVTRDEVDGLLQVYRGGAADGFARGVELVVQAMLQSPSFLYRVELGTRGGSVDGAVRLTPHEIAARLSYGLWGTMPDDGLRAAADAGALGTPDQVAAAARRLLRDARARGPLVEFVARWFGVPGLDEVMKDPEQYPQWNEALIGSMRGGVAAFLEDALFARGGADAKLSTLLSASRVFVDASLAPLYGVAAAGGAGYTAIDLPGGQRSGLLTNVGVLTAHTFSDESAAIHRGKFVRERLLCSTPPNPPADLMVEPPTPQPGVTTRERLVQHVADPACRPCHELMDSIGFAFERYDGLGRLRTMDHGKPVDDSGELTFTDVDGKVQGVGPLAQRLLASGQVRDCVAATFLRHVSGSESEIDSCAKSTLREAFAASGGDLGELIVAITRSQAFGYRQLLPGEVLP